MRFAILLIPLIMLAVFWAGRVTADRQPGDNHQQMARFIDRLLEADSLTAFLSREQQAEAEDLVKDFYTTNHPQESK